MRSFSAILLVVLFSACSAYEDTPGVVYKVDEGSVRILDSKNFGNPAEPTKRMIEQASEACPGASYLSARPSTADHNTYEYVFRC